MKCSVCGRHKGRIVNSKKYNAMLCEKHYKQMLRHGEITNSSSYLTSEPNEILTNGDLSEVVIKNRYGEEVARAVIDTKNKHLVEEHKWNLMNQGYVGSGAGAEQILLHRLLTDCPDDMYVDHINRDPMDNRMANMRIVTNQQNNINKGMYKHNTSGYKGVTWDKSRNKWIAQISVDGKNIFLGRFECKEKAYEARLSGENKYFKKIMEEVK